MPGQHAILSPSSSKRWMTCPASARLEALEPSRDTVYTREGTIAHAFAESCLTHLIDSEGLQGIPDGPDEASQIRLKEDCGADFDADEIAATVYENYVRLVYEDYLNGLAGRPDDTLLLVERKFRLDGYVPEGFGSSDAVIVSGRTLHVYDLKYGKGVRVSAEGNTQMRLYALGAWLSLGRDIFDFERVEMTIIQPRLGWVSTDAMKLEELTEWAERTLKPAAELAWSGKGPAVPGDHCKFCRVAHKCRALAEYASSDTTDPKLMDDTEIAAALTKAATVRTWIDALESRALESALSGTRYDGFKLVEGRSIRAISDKAAAQERLAEKFDEDTYMKPRELKTITELEKSLTKKGFAALLGDLVVKPAGKPTLVPADDPRPEMNRPDTEFGDIINNLNN